MMHRRANTLFTHLFGLLVGTIVLSHIISFALFMLLYRDDQSCHRGPDAGLYIGLGMELLALTSAAWLGARIVARPMQRLASAAAKLGDDVDAPALTESGPLEARLAARAFNRMQAALRAQLANRARFLAAVSHDLRTPLTRIRLRVERIAEADARTKLRGDVAEMATMLDGTLDYLRGEAAAEGLVMLDVQALLVSMVEDYQEQGCDIQASGAAAPLLARPTALRRALANLIENALHYGGQARLVYRDGPAGLVITIQDRGPGIPDAELVAVLQPFYRLESSRNKGGGGVGLGLAIAREAIERHAGTLTLMNGRSGGLIAMVCLQRRPAS